MAGVTIVLDTATPLLSRLRDEAARGDLVLVGGRAAGQLVRDHLVQLNTERHRYGRGYYAQAAQSVTVTKVGQGAAISITQTGFRQRLFGGPIDPVNSKFLTIPASPEAYGRRAGEFPDLEMTKTMDENGTLRWALVRRPSTPIRFQHRKQADGSIKTKIVPGLTRGAEVMFWLVAHVNQEPDPTVLPADDFISATALAAMQRRFERLSDPASEGGSS
jgi:hypothetical protein